MSGVMKTCVVKFIRQGVGISVTDVEYADSTSSTEAPTAGWQTNAPTWQNGHYIWTRTKIVYTDGTTRYSDPVCLPSGKGIVNIVEQYYKSTSATSLTGGSWQDTPPTWESGRYIWTRSKITYTDGTTAYTDPVNTTGATGATGPQGPTGPTGPQGPAGEDGKDGKDGTNGTNGVSFRKINAAAREYTLALWHQYGDPGHTKTWGVSGYDNSHIVVGDTVYITGKVSDCKDAAGNMVDAMAFGTCTAKTSTVITMYTTNLIIGGTKGDKGDNGGRGPALRGPQDWDALPTSYYFYQGAEGETYKDVVLYGGNFYSCIKTHNKRSGVVPTDATYWQLADKVEIIASKILLSTYALIQNLGASAIEMKDPNTGQTLFYAKDGTVSCKVGIFENVTVSGTVNATAGTIGGMEIVKNGGVYYTRSNVFALKRTTASGSTYYMASSEAYVHANSSAVTEVALPQYPVGGSFVAIHNETGNTITIRSRTGNFFGESISSFSLANGKCFLGFFVGDSTAAAGHYCMRIKY